MLIPFCTAYLLALRYLQHLKGLWLHHTATTERSAGNAGVSENSLPGVSYLYEKSRICYPIHCVMLAVRQLPKQLY